MDARIATQLDDAERSEWTRLGIIGERFFDSIKVQFRAVVARGARRLLPLWKASQVDGLRHCAT